MLDQQIKVYEDNRIRIGSGENCQIRLHQQAESEVAEIFYDESNGEWMIQSHAKQYPNQVTIASKLYDHHFINDSLGIRYMGLEKVIGKEWDIERSSQNEN